MKYGNNDLFRPPWWLPGAILQTVVPTLWPPRDFSDEDESLLVQVAPGNRVRLEIDRPDTAPRGTLLLVHGMGGSARARYMLRTAHRAVGRGWIAVRMNLRNCGGTEHYASTLYNAGQSGDAEQVLAELERSGFPRPFALVGFSLGGNLALRYAGATGGSCLADSVIGVNPPVDLERCLRELERPRNWLYHLYYTLKLCRALSQIRRTRTVQGPPARLRFVRGMRRFDGLFTAPDAGHPTAEAYYAEASAAKYLAQIARPALVLSAANDPFVPVEIFEPCGRLRHVRCLHPREGGHCGYWQSRKPRFWAAEAILEFAENTSGPTASDRPGL